MKHATNNGTTEENKLGVISREPEVLEPSSEAESADPRGPALLISTGDSVLFPDDPSRLLVVVEIPDPRLVLFDPVALAELFRFSPDEAVTDPEVLAPRATASDCIPTQKVAASWTTVATKTMLPFRLAGAIQTRAMLVLEAGVLWVAAELARLPQATPLANPADEVTSQVPTGLESPPTVDLAWMKKPLNGGLAVDLPLMVTTYLVPVLPAVDETELVFVVIALEEPEVVVLGPVPGTSANDIWCRAVLAG